MMTPYKIDIILKATRIYRKNIDKLIELADLDRKNNNLKLFKSMDGEGIDIDALNAVLVDWPQLAFSLYALAVVHCYSILENNRKLICLQIPGLSDKQKKGLHNINVVYSCLESVDIDHKKIRCYKTMEEFRLVNNAIKHARYGLSTSVTTEKKKYSSRQLKSLYVNKAKHLESYLSDLHRRVCFKSGCD